LTEAGFFYLERKSLDGASSMMIDRYFLDKFLPQEERTLDLARQALGGENVSVERVLEEFKKLQADDYLSSDPRPQHQRYPNPGQTRYEWRNFRFEGFSFKPEDNYFTELGWPLGTECWYLRYSLGHRVIATGETQLFAVARSIVLAKLDFKLRSQFRYGFKDYVAETLLQSGPVTF
jgi:hypothetical protein